MVRKKKLRKNILVFALALCMILTSVQPTISVRADEATTVADTDSSSENSTDQDAETSDNDDSAADSEDLDTTDDGEDGSLTDDTDGSDTDNGDETVSDSDESVTTDTVSVSAALLMASEDEDSYDLSNGALTISEDGSYTIKGTYTGTDTAAITVEQGVKATITLNEINVTVTGEEGEHRAGIYIKDGANVTLILQGTSNEIVGKVLDPSEEVISTGVIGICIGGTPADSASSSGGTIVTITGSSSLNINTVGTGISLTTGNALTIDGTSLNIDDVYMMDTTISGLGIYSNGELVIQNGANVSISDVNLQNQSGTHISYNNGYGIDSQNGGTITITGDKTVVNIKDCYKAGIYSSYSYDEETDTYSGNTITVSDKASLNINVENASLTSSSGIRMENHGEIDVVSGGSITVDNFAVFGITIGYKGTINLDGEDSEINLLGGNTAENGIYAGDDVIINVTDKGSLSIKNIKAFGINYEYGYNEKAGIFVSGASLNIETSNGAGIYAMGGTVSVEFTDGATVSMNVDGNCIGSNGEDSHTDDAGNTYQHPTTGHILMTGNGTTVDFKTDGAAIACNFKYLKIDDYANVSIETALEGIGLGTSVNDGTKIVVTGHADFSIESGRGNGIVTYFSDHYIEVSDGAKMTLSGVDGTGIVLSTDNTWIYVSDATLNIMNTNGVVVSSTGNLLYEDSLSHIEATNIYSSGDGDMDFIAMGGTLTYDFNHENNIWPYNAYWGTDVHNKTPQISGFADNAFDVNDVDPVRIINYKKDEALVNFIVPTDSSHLSFAATYQCLADYISTYTYKSDDDKEEDTLSIWVPGIEVYYNFDESTDLLDTDLTGKYVSELEEDSTVNFVLLYEEEEEPYDMVIRGQSLRFSALSVATDSITLKYARVKGNEIIDHVRTDSDGIAALYKTQYEAIDGMTYDIQWYYGNTIFTATEDNSNVADDSKTDDGPLNVFATTSSVYREAEANVYGLLTTSAEEDVDWDISKSKEATNLDENYVSTVTLSLPSAEYEPVTDVVFVLDRSSSSDPARYELASMLKELLTLVNDTDAVIRVGVVNFSYQVDSGIELTELSDDTIASIEKVIWPTHQSGTNIQAGIDAGVAMLDADTDVDDDSKYLILLTDGISHAWTDDEGTVMTLWGEGYADNQVVFNGANSYYSFDTTKTAFSTIYAMNSSDSALNSGKDVPVYNSDGSLNTITIASGQGSYLVYEDNVNEYETYLSGTEKAVYYAAHAYADAAAKYKCISLYWNTDGYEVANQFMNWTATLGKAYYIGSAGAATEFGGAFTEIKNEIYYLLGAGSYVTDYIGYVEGDYNFDFVKDTFVLTVGTTEYTATGVYDETTGTYTYTFADGAYEVVYYPETLKDDEYFIWYINVNVSIADSVSLSYDVVLTNPETAAGTYGTYDQYGVNGSTELYTNNSATLYPVDSEGNPGDHEDFNKPTVSYTVVSETTETEDPEDTTETEETETTETTVASEVVSAVTGDNAPIGVAILVAAVSEFTLLILIFLQMRKKKNHVI